LASPYPGVVRGRPHRNPPTVVDKPLSSAGARLQTAKRSCTSLSTDPLTGVRTPAAGLLELDHELERSRRRIGVRLVVVYVDVVGLKTVNDSQGHAAGDALLKRVVAIHQRALASV
jgi:two-component system, cell cycle response regulator